MLHEPHHLQEIVCTLQLWWSSWYTFVKCKLFSYFFLSFFSFASCNSINVWNELYRSESIPREGIYGYFCALNAGGKGWILRLASLLWMFWLSIWNSHSSIYWRDFYSQVLHSYKVIWYQATHTYGEKERMIRIFCTVYLYIYMEHSFYIYGTQWNNALMNSSLLCDCLCVHRPIRYTCHQLSIESWTVERKTFNH